MGFATFDLMRRRMTEKETAVEEVLAPPVKEVPGEKAKKK